MESITLFNEDCFNTLKRDITFDLVITSPPYNMTKRKGGYADRGRYDIYIDWKSEEEYLKFTLNLFNALSKKLNNNGVVLYNFSYSIENPSLPYKVVTEIEKDSEFTLVDTIVWKKKAGLPFPANSRRLSRNWEFIWVFCRKSELSTFNTARKIVKTSKKGQNYYEVLYNYIEANNNDSKTPKLNEATFSTDLVNKLLNIYARPDSVIYDPFMGTGTTAKACQQLGLKCFGSEISKAQCEYALKRLSI